jgi:hypothetical protein
MKNETNTDLILVQSLHYIIRNLHDVLNRVSVPTGSRELGLNS